MAIIKFDKDFSEAAIDPGSTSKLLLDRKKS
jgi:hypothetical protein